jgi:hypothetical protein
LEFVPLLLPYTLNIYYVVFIINLSVHLVTTNYICNKSIVGTRGNEQEPPRDANPRRRGSFLIRRNKQHENNQRHRKVFP